MRHVAGTGGVGRTLRNAMALFDALSRINRCRGRFLSLLGSLLESTHSKDPVMSPAHHLGAALSAALGDFPPVLQAMHCHM